MKWLFPAIVIVAAVASAQPAVDAARVRALLEPPELVDNAWGA
jgi:hypothetical protein